MATVARWAVASSVGAPVLLVGGWTVAAARQRDGFDPVARSISALAALDADQRWIMTSALAGVGLCHLATALGLRPAASPGRTVLATGGAATVLVAAFPLPAGGGGSTAHSIAATTAFCALAGWPALSRSAAPDTPAALRRRATLGAAAVLVGLLGWFGTQLGGGPHLGLAERVAAGAQAIWPLVVVLSARRARACPRTVGPAGIPTGAGRPGRRRRAG